MAEIVVFTAPGGRLRQVDLCRRFWSLYRNRFGVVDLQTEAELLDTYTRMMQGESAGLQDEARRRGEAAVRWLRLKEAICRVGRSLFYDGDAPDAPVDQVALVTYEAVREQILARKAEARRVRAAANVVIFPKSARYWRV